MKLIKRISIIGVGLIGGSLALALKQARPRLSIVGYDRSPVVQKALKRGAIDEAAADLISAVTRSDCLIFATPISSTLELLRPVGKFVSPETIVSDVCSVKTVVMRAAEKSLPKDVLFVGGHPMAGSETGGIDAADPLLFENAYYILCPQKRDRRISVKERERVVALADLIESAGARVIFLDAEDHDRIIASVSHVPQLLAVALTNLVGRHGASHSLRLAAGGFRDLTRVASSPYAMWDDILRTNKKEISRSLEKLIRELQEYKDSIDSSRLDKMRDQFRRARKFRGSIPIDMKGFHRPLVDVFVSVEDKPGEISRISTALAQSRINIKDMELMKVREGEMGTFRISFQNHQIANQAVKILKKAGYRIIRQY